MVDFSLEEAQLFRLLTGLFGRDNVVPRMRLIAVCGGHLPEELSEAAQTWSQEASCLFTVVDGADSPKMVVEFFDGFESFVDATQEARQRFLPAILRRRDIHYLTFSSEDLREVLSSDVTDSFRILLQAKFEDASDM